MAGGRPTDYNLDLARFICDKVASSTEGLQRLCDKYDEFPANAATIHAWKWKSDEFNNMYRKAKASQADLLVEQCLDIADETSRDSTTNKQGDEVCNSEYINRSRLRVDTRKWLATKLLHKVYGDKPADNTANEANSLLEKILNGEIEIKKK